MRSSSRFEGLAARFGPYVGELHTFLSTCDVAFGTSSDIPPFADRLSTPGYLRDGVCAMVRSVIYREQERISQVDLLELVMIAVGGTDVDEDAPEFEQARRKLSRVIGQAMASLWNMPPVRQVPQAEAEHSAEVHPAHPGAEHPPQHEAIAATAAMPRIPAAFAVPPARAAVGVPPNGSSPHQAAEPTPLSSLPAEPAEPPLTGSLIFDATRLEAVAPAKSVSPASVEIRLEPMHPPQPHSHPRHPIVPIEVASPPRLIWLAGLLALLMAPVLDLIVHRHHTPPPPVPVKTRPYRPQPVEIPAPVPAPAPATQQSSTISPDDLDLGLPEPKPARHSRTVHSSASSHKSSAQTPAQQRPDPASFTAAKSVDLPSSVRSSLPDTSEGTPGPTQAPPAPQR